MNKKQARRHSVFVRTARLCLPVVITGIVAAYGVTATPRTIDQDFLRQFQNLEVVSEDLRMEKPRFLGEDTAGVPYEINAGAATQNPRMPKFIVLENPEAFKALGHADQALVKAKTGMYSLDAKTIQLNSEVEFKQGIGSEEFVLSMDAAEVRLEDRSVHSDVDVFGENKNGSISAEGMTAYQDEGRTVFHKARMVIKPRNVEDEEQIPEASEENSEQQTPET